MWVENSKGPCEDRNSRPSTHEHAPARITARPRKHTAGAAHFRARLYQGIKIRCVAVPVYPPPIQSPRARTRPGNPIKRQFPSCIQSLVVGIHRDVTRLNGVHLNPTADPTPLALPRRRRGTRAPVQALAAKVRACRAAAVAVARCAFSRAAPAPARGAGRLACMAQLNGRTPPLPRGPACPARPSKTCSRATNRGEERSGRKRARGRADAAREPGGGGAVPPAAPS